MIARFDSKLVSTFRRFSSIAGISTAALGLIVLCGWALHIEFLIETWPSLASMKAVTALALLAGGLSLWLQREDSSSANGRRFPRVGVIPALACLALGIDSLGQDLSAWNTGVDQLLFRSFGSPGDLSSGSMAPNIATCFIALGLALLFLDHRTRRGYSPSQFLAVVPGGLAYLTLLAYVIRPTVSSRVTSDVGMALHTATAIALLTVGTLAARPERAGWIGLLVSSTPGGFLMRRFLPVILFMPLAVTWLRVKGPRFDWYRMEFGFVIPAVATVLSLFVMLLWSSKSLNRVAAARESAIDALQDREQSLQRLAGRLRSLHKIDLDILAAHTTQEIADATLARMAALLPCDRASLVLFPAGEDSALFLSVWEREPLGPPAGSRVPLREFSPTSVLRNERYVSDLAVSCGPSNLLGQMQKRGLGSALSMPIILRSDLIGELNFSAVIPSAFHDEHIEIAREVTTQLAVALHNARVHAELRNSEDNFRSLVQNSPLGIYRSSPDGKFLTVNRALVEILGYESEAELMAKDMAQDVYADPEKRQRIMVDSDVRQDFQDYEVRWKRKDGTMITVALSGRPLLDQAGNVQAFEVIAEDITQRRSLEEQLRQSQKIEAVGQLAAGIAHDFNNVLGVILGYAELVQARYRAGDPVYHQLEEIQKAGQRAATMTRQLLAFTRQQVLEVRVLDVNKIVTDIQPMLERLIGENIEFVKDLKPDLGNVKVDPGQIEQVLLNLVINARDAMPRGGRLMIETADAEIDDAYVSQHYPAVPGRYVMVAVSDTGIGMDEKTKAHIFEPFFTTKEKGKGTGLGLATVYGVVKQSGGFIWVYSEPGQGTSFKVLLPRVDEVAQVSAPRPRLESWRGSETILLVEDATPLRRLTRQLLEASGYTVLEAADPSQALEIIRHQPTAIHLLVTDVVMPGMSGPELATAITNARTGIRILYTSGYTGTAVARHGVLEHGGTFLQKPYTKDALTRKVREVLDAATPVA